MTTLEINVVGSFGSVVEDLPQSVELDGNMQGTLESVLRVVVSEPLLAWSLVHSVKWFNFIGSIHIQKDWHV